MRFYQATRVLLAAALAAAVVNVLEMASRGSFSQTVTDPIWMKALYVALTSFFPSLLLLLPSFVVLAGIGRLNVWTTLVIGVAFGAVLTAENWVLMRSFAYVRRPSIGLLSVRMELVGVAAALAGWAAWWLTTRRQRPVGTAEMF